MIFPHLTAKPKKSVTVDRFGGIHTNGTAGEGEWDDAENLSSEAYPALKTRKSRGFIKTLTAPHGMIAKESLILIDGQKLYVGDEEITGITLSDDEEMLPKQLISMGADLIIFPDGIRYHTLTGAVDSINCRTETMTSSRISPGWSDGTEPDTYPVSSTPPAGPSDGDLWLDTAGTVHILKQYNSTAALWTSLNTTYVKIESPGIGVGFHPGDGVTIAGCTDESLGEFNRAAVIANCGSNYILIPGLIDSAVITLDKITVTRQAPRMDFIIESGNRLFGCRYGVKDGEPVNEIYGSALGDPTNWQKFEGLSTDSYAVSLGDDGPFTGAVTYGGSPLFFRENRIHKILGTMPSNYQVVTTVCRGVKAGCEKTLTILNEVLYYLSVNAICAYRGGNPASVSDALGELHLTNGAAGGIGQNYYLSAAEGDEKITLTYDTVRGIFFRETPLDATDFADYSGDLYYLDREGRLGTVLGTAGQPEEKPAYRLITPRIGMRATEKTKLTHIYLHVTLPLASTLTLSCEYDKTGHFEHLATYTGQGQKSLLIPVRPRRCDFFRLMLSGQGEMTLYALTRHTETGGTLA